MFKKIILLLIFSLLPLSVFAANYLDGALLRAEGDIKVYLINNNIKRWVSSLEVFDSRGFKWQNVKVVSKKKVTAIKEGEPVVLESPSPSPEASPAVEDAAGKPEEKAPIPVKLNADLPAPDYIRADWLTSHATSNYGRVGQRIVFKYSDKERHKIENFNLYEKKPGNKYFHKIAAFEEILSTGCEDIDIDGEWMVTEAGECGYWSIQKIKPPGGRGTAAYLPAADFLVGEYAYYVAGADKDGFETSRSSEAKLVFLDTIDILSPVDGKQTKAISPVFEWTVADNWPSLPENADKKSIAADYFVMVSDSKSALNPVWTKQLKIPLGETSRQLDYDGVGLDPAGKYKVNIYGYYRSSSDAPDYISIPLNNPEFWVPKPGWSFIFKNIFATILRDGFKTPFLLQFLIFE